MKTEIDTIQAINGIPAVMKAAAQLHKLGIYKANSDEYNSLEYYSEKTLQECAKNKNPGVKALAVYEIALRAAGINHKKYRELMDKAIPQLEHA